MDEKRDVGFYPTVVNCSRLLCKDELQLLATSTFKLCGASGTFTYRQITDKILFGPCGFLIASGVALQM